MSSLSPFAQVGPSLLALGYCVIPIAPPDAEIKSAGKIPAFYAAKHWHPLKGWNDFHSRYPTETEMAAWCEYPNANIGVVCGSLSRIVALDFDYNVDGIHDMIRDWIPESPVIKTGAKGFTAFYYYNDDKWASFETQGQTVIEILPYGRQTVIPPSVHTHGMDYRWLTDKALWDVNPEDLPTIPDDFHGRLVELFKTLNPEKVISIPSGDKKPHTGDVTFAKTSFKKLREALSFIDPDAYWTWLYTGMSIKDYYGDEGFQVWDEWSDQSPKHRDGKQKTTTKWKSFRRSGRSIASVFAMAQENGFVNVPEFDGESESWESKHQLPDEAKDIVLPAYIPIKNEKTGETKIQSVNVLASGRQFHTEPDFNSSKYHDLCLYAPGVIGDTVQWMCETAPFPQPILSMAACLAFFGVVRGHRVQTSTGLRTNLYTMGIASSGSGKNHPLVCVNQLIKFAMLESMKGGKPASAAGLLKGLHTAQGRHYIQIDEFGRFMKNVTNQSSNQNLYQITTLLMELFSSANTSYTGSQYANADNKRKREDIEQPCLGIYATTVARNLYESVTDAEAVDGFLSRWLIFESTDFQLEEQQVLPHEFPPPEHIIKDIRSWQDFEVNHKDKDPVAALINGPDPAVIQMSAQAQDLFNVFKLDIRKKMQTHVQKNTGLDSIYARTAEHAAKIALTAFCSGNMIDVDEITWSCDIARWATEYLCYVVQTHISSNKNESEYKKVLALIKKSGEKGIQKRTLTRKTQFLSNTRRRGEILGDMIETGVITSANLGTKENPKIIYYAVKQDEESSSE